MRYVGLRRDNLRSHFVFRPRHAPEWLRARFLLVVFLTNEDKLTGKTFTTSLTTTNTNTYVKFIFLRTSPLTGAFSQSSSAFYRLRLSVLYKEKSPRLHQKMSDRQFRRQYRLYMQENGQDIIPASPPSKHVSSKPMMNFEYLILRQVLTWLNSDQEWNVNRMVIPDLRGSAKCNVQTRKDKFVMWAHQTACILRQKSSPVLLSEVK